MADFKECFEETMSRESRPGHDYTNDKDDPGGETYRGITRRDYPTWTGWSRIDGWRKLCGDMETFLGHVNSEEVRKALQPEVFDFYEKEFFLPLGLNTFEVQEIAKEIFDTAVNCGRITAGKIFQRALNFLNDNGKLFEDLTVDGLIGQGTMAAMAKALSRPNGKRLLLHTLNREQYVHYREAMIKNPRLEKYVGGWVDRTV